jgi:hypothetical protein
METLVSKVIMDPQIKFALYLYGTIILIAIFHRIRIWNKQYRENKLFWKAFEEKIARDNKEFVEKLFNSLMEHPEFQKLVNLAALHMQKTAKDNPVPVQIKLTRMQKIKQWVINIF